MSTCSPTAVSICTDSSSVAVKQESGPLPDATFAGGIHSVCWTVTGAIAPRWGIADYKVSVNSPDQQLGRSALRHSEIGRVYEDCSLDSSDRPLCWRCGDRRHERAHRVQCQREGSPLDEHYSVVDVGCALGIANREGCRPRWRELVLTHGQPGSARPGLQADRRQPVHPLTN